jgi:hypothetical protein
LLRALVSSRVGRPLWQLIAINQLQFSIKSLRSMRVAFVPQVSTFVANSSSFPLSHYSSSESDLCIQWANAEVVKKQCCSLEESKNFCKEGDSESI